MLHPIRSLSSSHHLDSLILRLICLGLGRRVEKRDDLEEGRENEACQLSSLLLAPQVIYYVPDLLGLGATARWVYRSSHLNRRWFLYLYYTRSITSVGPLQKDVLKTKQIFKRGLSTWDWSQVLSYILRTEF